MALRGTRSFCTNFIARARLVSAMDQMKFIADQGALLSDEIYINFKCVHRRRRRDYHYCLATICRVLVKRPIRLIRDISRGETETSSSTIFNYHTHTHRVDVIIR